MAGLLSFLSDIKVRPPEIAGPLAQLLQSQYELKNLKYPSDLGANDKGHYLVININVQKSTQFKSDINVGAAARRFDTGPGGAGVNSLLRTVSNAADTVKELGSSFVGFIEGKINNLGVPTDTSGTVVGTTKSAIGASLTGIIKNIGDGVRATSQISTVIYLYMPDTLNFDQNQKYDNPSRAGLASGIASAGQSVADVMTSGGSTDEKISKGVSNLTPFAAKAFLSTFGGKMGDVLFTAGTGLVQNPLMEVLYTQPEFLEGENAWFNETTNSKENVNKCIKFWSLPNILIVDFKRFNNANKKLNNIIKTPLLGLDLSKYVVGYNKDKYIYELFGICNHHGECLGGHYTAYVKNSNQKWYDFNDTNVNEISESQLITPKGYCYFYRKLL
jgi:hypothetical protein